MRNQNFKRVLSPLFFLVALIAVSSDLQAAKIFGFGDKDHDISFLGTPVGAHAMRAGEQVDAVEALGAGDSPGEVVIFRIDRVVTGEFPKIKRGGASRIDQAQEAVKNKDFVNLVGLNFKNPHDEMDRETLRIAVKNAGETFGIALGEPLQYFQHKIYLKRLSKKSQTYLFVKSQPKLKRD